MSCGGGGGQRSRMFVCPDRDLECSSVFQWISDFHPPLVALFSFALSLQRGVRLLAEDIRFTSRVNDIIRSVEPHSPLHMNLCINII